MSDAKKVKVLCVGSTSQDIFFPTDEYTTIETPDDLTAKEKVLFEIGGKFRVKDRYEAIGGVATNVSIGLSRQGVATACVTSIGDDPIGSWCLSELEKNGVDTSFVTRQPDTKTDLSAIIVLMQSGERIIFHNRDANEKLRVQKEDLSRSEWVFVSALNGAWRENLTIVLSCVRENDISLALNPGQHNLREDPELILSALRNTTLLCLNKDEATELLLASEFLTVTEKKTAINDEATLIRALHKAGAKIISLTDGARGAWASDGHSMYHANILPHINSVDMTGAGDAFGSAFFGALLQGLPLETALRYGIGNGASVVQYYGAIEGLLSMGALETLTQNLKVEKIR